MLALTRSAPKLLAIIRISITIAAFEAIAATLPSSVTSGRPRRRSIG